MFNLGFSEMVIIGVLALILIGPKQLPEVARTLGKFLNELKRSADVLKEEINTDITKNLSTRPQPQVQQSNKPPEYGPESIADTEISEPKDESKS